MKQTVNTMKYMIYSCNKPNVSFEHLKGTPARLQKVCVSLRSLSYVVPCIKVPLWIRIRIGPQHQWLS